MPPGGWPRVHYILCLSTSFALCIVEADDRRCHLQTQPPRMSLLGQRATESGQVRARCVSSTGRLLRQPVRGKVCLFGETPPLE